MKIKLVTMQRDERVMLEVWLRYHGYLFGFENLTVIDNGSTDEGVLAALRRYEGGGVTVVRGFGTPRDFDAKGALVGEVIRALDRGPAYDFVLPMDCDELVALWQDGDITCARESIHRHFEKISSFSGCFRVYHHLWNIPGDPGWYIPTRATRTFFLSNTFTSIDHGFHFGRSLVGETHMASNLAYFHFHNKRFSDLVESAKNKLRPFIDPDDRDAVAQYNGPGCHLVKNLMGTKEDYEQRYNFDFRVSLPLLGGLLKLLGLSDGLFDGGDDSPHLAFAENRNRNGTLPVFNADAYRRKWLDVAVSGMDPLLHYINLGRGEGREIA